MPNADSADHVDVAEVSALSEAYEAALIRNDIDAMNDAFVRSSETLRFGIADAQTGYDEIVAWRAGAAPVSPTRVITGRVVHRLADGVVAVDLTFRNGDEPFVGRQSQTWVRTPEGWRIARAHVSVIPD